MTGAARATATIVLRILRTDRACLLILAGAMVAWFALIMLVTRSAAADVQAKTEMFDSPLTRGFGLGSLVTPDGILAQLVGVSFNHPIVLALVGGATVTYGARACQGELRDGTLEFALARSVSRTSHLLAYAIVILVSLTMLMVVAWASMIGFERAFDVPGTLDAGRAAVMCVNAGVSFLGFGAIALVASVFGARARNATFVTIGILVMMFAITFAERAWDADWLDVAGPLSLFHWYDPAPVLLGVSVPASHVLIPAAIAVGLFVVALWRFEHRDL